MVAIQSDAQQWAKLDGAQKRIIESSIRDMRLSGVGLDGADRERFKVRRRRKKTGDGVTAVTR